MLLYMENINENKILLFNLYQLHITTYYYVFTTFFHHATCNATFYYGLISLLRYHVTNDNMQKLYEYCLAYAKVLFYMVEILF